MDFLFPTFGHHHKIPFDSFWPKRASCRDNRWWREQEYLRQQEHAAKEAAACREALSQRYYFQQLQDQQAKLKQRWARNRRDKRAGAATKSDAEDADDGQQWREKRAAEIVRRFTEATTVIQRAWRRYSAVKSARSLLPSLRCLASIRARTRAAPAVGFDTLKGRRIFEHTLEKLTEESDAVDGCGSDLVRQLRKSTVVLIQSRLSELDDALVAPVEPVKMDSEPEGNETEPPSTAPPSAGTGVDEAEVSNVLGVNEAEVSNVLGVNEAEVSNVLGVNEAEVSNVLGVIGESSDAEVSNVLGVIGESSDAEVSNVLGVIGESSDSHDFAMVPEKIIDEFRLKDTAYGTLTDDDDESVNDGSDGSDGSDGNFTSIEAATEPDE